MKQSKLYLLYFIFSFLLIACTKDEVIDENVVKESLSNIEEAVQIGQPNCTEAISGKLRLKLSVDSTATSSNSTTVKINSKTEKLYPSGGYILVFNLTRTSSNIRLDYKQVNTSCGNPAAAAFLPATSAPRLSNLATGSYPIEISVNGVINKGVVTVPPSPGAPSLQMQTTNGIVVE